MSEKRIFETDDKFWEVWIDGSQVFTHFGKTGAAGQTKIKPTADEAAAEASLEDMVAKKKKEGFKQTGGPKPPAGPALDPKELKKLLAPLTSAQDPAVMVLADWLQGQNHPWGELIALQYGAATTPKKAAALEKAADKLLEDQREAILGALADDTRTQVTWHCGFAQRAVIGSKADAKSVTAALKRFLAQPIAKVVETIVLGPMQETFSVWRDWDSSEEHIVDPWPDLEKLAIPAHVTKLGFGAWPGTAASAYIELPSFTKLSKAFPKLTALELAGSGSDKQGKLSLPVLTELSIHLSHATATDLEAVAGSKLPKLERLTLGLGGHSYATVDEVYGAAEVEYGDDDEPVDEDASRYPSSFSAKDLESMNGYGDLNTNTPVDALIAVLASPPTKSLVHLGFDSSYLTAELLEAVVKSKLIKQLKTLDLSNGRLADDRVKVLIGAKKLLAHLESIDLRHTGLTPELGKKISAALPNANVGKLSKKPEAKGPDFFFRYVACME